MGTNKQYNCEVEIRNAKCNDIAQHQEWAQGVIETHLDCRFQSTPMTLLGNQTQPVCCPASGYGAKANVFMYLSISLRLLKMN